MQNAKKLSVAATRGGRPKGPLSWCPAASVGSWAVFHFYISPCGFVIIIIALWAFLRCTKLSEWHKTIAIIWSKRLTIDLLRWWEGGFLLRVGLHSTPPIDPIKLGRVLIVQSRIPIKYVSFNLVCHAWQPLVKAKVSKFWYVWGINDLFNRTPVSMLTDGNMVRILLLYWSHSC